RPSPRLEAQTIPFRPFSPRSMIARPSSAREDRVERPRELLRAAALRPPGDVLVRTHQERTTGIDVQALRPFATLVGAVASDGEAFEWHRSGRASGPRPAGDQRETVVGEEIEGRNSDALTDHPRVRDARARPRVRNVVANRSGRCRLRGAVPKKGARPVGE